MNISLTIRRNHVMPRANLRKVWHRASGGLES